MPVEKQKKESAKRGRTADEDAGDAKPSKKKEDDKGKAKKQSKEELAKQRQKDSLLEVSLLT